MMEKFYKKAEEAMILTWIGDVRPLLQESCYRKYWRQIPDFRQEKADRLRFPMGRALSVGVWVLWQRAMREFGLALEAPFNLSHSGFYALCSAETGRDSRVQVGCDVERISDAQVEVARRFFCPQEYRAIQAQTDLTKRRQMFFRYWVLKESFIKATRQGMALALDSFSFRMDEGAHPVLDACPAPYRKEDFHFQEFALADYRAAVCSTDPKIDEQLRWVSF